MIKDETENLYTVFTRLSDTNKEVILGKAEALTFAQDFIRGNPGEQHSKDLSISRETMQPSG